jgi:hypothetical protein
MPYPAMTSRIVMQGHLGTSEIFETGVGIMDFAPPSSAAASTMAADWISNLAVPAKVQLLNLITADSGYDTCRVYSYPTGGTVAAFIGEALFTGWVGTASGINPNQVCMCMTTLTGLAGRKNRGRLYLPCNGNPITAGHVFATTEIAAVVAAMATTFTTWNAGGDEGTVAVISLAGSAANPVTQLSIDNVPDIQRRRANKMSTAIRSTAVVTP